MSICAYANWETGKRSHCASALAVNLYVAQERSISWAGDPHFCTRLTVKFCLIILFHKRDEHLSSLNSISDKSRQPGQSTCNWAANYQKIFVSADRTLIIILHKILCNPDRHHCEKWFAQDITFTASVKLSFMLFRISGSQLVAEKDWQ